jgi:ABC-type glycerol-3-phosphate transport system permease component
VILAFAELSQQDFSRWFVNSVVVAVFVTVVWLLSDSMAGYALARLRFRGRGAVFSAVIAVMGVPSVVLLIPKFLVIRTLRFYDSHPGLIVPLLADAMGVFIKLAVGVLMTIPVASGMASSCAAAWLIGVRCRRSSPSGGSAS